MNTSYKLLYDLKDDKSMLVVTLITIEDTTIYSITKEYNLIEYDETMLLYNKMLDDFDAEYNDILATMIDALVDKIIKENESEED